MAKQQDRFDADGVLNILVTRGNDGPPSRNPYGGGAGAGTWAGTGAGASGSMAVSGVGVGGITTGRIKNGRPQGLFGGEHKLTYDTGYGSSIFTRGNLNGGGRVSVWDQDFDSDEVVPTNIARLHQYNHSAAAVNSLELISNAYNLAIQKTPSHVRQDIDNAIHAAGTPHGLTPASLTARNKSVIDSLIQARNREYQIHLTNANAYFGSDPLSKSIKDFTARLPAYKPGETYAAYAAWANANIAAYTAKVVMESVRLLSIKSNELAATLVVQQQAEAAARQIAQQQAEAAARQIAQQQAEAAARRQAQEKTEAAAQLARQQAAEASRRLELRAVAEARAQATIAAVVATPVITPASAAASKALETAIRLAVSRFLATSVPLPVLVSIVAAGFPSDLANGELRPSDSSTPLTPPGIDLLGPTTLPAASPRPPAYPGGRVVPNPTQNETLPVVDPADANASIPGRPADEELPSPGAVFNYRPGDHAYHPKPLSLPAFPDAKRATSKTLVQGGGAQRPRWKDRHYIYEWDGENGAVEKYNNRGHHLGEFDHNTGFQTKPANPARRIEP